MIPEDISVEQLHYTKNAVTFQRIKLMGLKKIATKLVASFIFIYKIKKNIRSKLEIERA